MGWVALGMVTKFGFDLKHALLAACLFSKRNTYIHFVYEQNDPNHKVTLFHISMAKFLPGVPIHSNSLLLSAHTKVTKPGGQIYECKSEPTLNASS